MLIVTNSPAFKDWFFDKFSEWEKAQPGRRSNYTAFAKYLSNNSLGIEIKQQYVSNWVNGKIPSEKYAHPLAEILGNDVYKLLGYERPNPYLQKIHQIWDRIPPDKQQQLVEQAEHYELKNDDIKRTSQQRKTSTP